MSTCPTCEEQVLEFVYEELAPSARARFEEHLRASAVCAREAAELRAIEDLTRRRVAEEPSPALLAGLKAEARKQVAELRATRDRSVRLEHRAAAAAMASVDDARPGAVSRLADFFSRTFRVPVWVPALGALVLVAAAALHVTREGRMSSGASTVSEAEVAAKVAAPRPAERRQEPAPAAAPAAAPDAPLPRLDMAERAPAPVTAVTAESRLKANAAEGDAAADTAATDGIAGFAPRTAAPQSHGRDAAEAKEGERAAAASAGSGASFNRDRAFAEPPPPAAAPAGRAEEASGRSAGSPAREAEAPQEKAASDKLAKTEAQNRAPAAPAARTKARPSLAETRGSVAQAPAASVSDEESSPGARALAGGAAGQADAASATTPSDASSAGDTRTAVDSPRRAGATTKKDQGRDDLLGCLSPATPVETALRLCMARGAVADPDGNLALAAAVPAALALGRFDDARAAVRLLEQRRAREAGPARARLQQALGAAPADSRH